MKGRPCLAMICFCLVSFLLWRPAHGRSLKPGEQITLTPASTQSMTLDISKTGEYLLETLGESDTNCTLVEPTQGVIASDRIRQQWRGQLSQPLGCHEPAVNMAQGSGRHRYQFRQGGPLPPVVLPHQRADGRIGFEAIAGGLGHLRGVGGIEEIESVIKIHRITA